MSNRPLILYPGDNGVHLFWEDPRSELLIFKNRGEKVWLALYKDKVIEDDKELKRRRKTNPNIVSVSLSSKTDKDLARKIAKLLNLKVYLATTKRWVKGPNPKVHMILTDIAAAPLHTPLFPLQNRARIYILNS